MKKVSVLIAGVFFLILSMGAKAQTNTGMDFFTGKWNVITTGLPDGDRKMVLTLERKEGKLTGTINFGSEDSKITSVEEKENSITVYFSAGGYDVNLSLEKKDEDHVTGSLMGAFDAKGERMAVKNETAITNNTQAQSDITSEEYFIGKWNVLVKDSPLGKTTMVITIEKKENKLTGNMTDPNNPGGILVFSSVGISGTTLTASMNTMGMDISVTMNKKDNNSITGFIMALGKNEIEGSRAK